MAVVRWDPFSELDSLHNQINTMFNQAFAGQEAGVGSATTDIYNDEKGMTIEMHLPNFAEEEITVQQHNNSLEIKAEHKEKDEKKGRKYLLRESSAQYFRRFTLPRNVDADNIKAEFENGLLKVAVPFKELPAPKQITVKTKK